MIVLDTNVVSEMMRAASSTTVLGWLRAQPDGRLFTTVLTQAEIFYGLTLLPAGRRRDVLIEAARPIFESSFAGRVLPFDADAAMAYPTIMAGRRSAGRPIGQIDAQIAAIVRSRGARLATRSGRDFDGCGIEVVDPWTAP